jgi:DNA-binding transcriptional ArsR family regulator
MKKGFDSKKLTELFINDEASLEILLMLADKGPKTIGQISREIEYEKST